MRTPDRHVLLMRSGAFLALIALLLAANSSWAQEAPVEVSVCDLAKHPDSFDRKTIRARGTLNVEFEDFSLAISDCDTRQEIWLAFGGDVPGIVASTVNDTVRRPGVDIEVNGVSYGIKKDESFRRLYALISARHGDKSAYRVTATLTGAFFAGEKSKLADGQTVFEGYGHLGCCSLLVITQVGELESVPPANLNVSGTVSGPDGKPVQGFVVIDDVIGGLPPARQQTTTNSKGEFEFSDSGQLLRFENQSYRPLAVFVEHGGAPVHVRLTDAKRSDWVVPGCEQQNDSASRVGFSVLFTVPKTMESSPFDDGGSHAYFIFPRGGEPSAAKLIISISGKKAEASSSISDSGSSEHRWIKNGARSVVGIDSRGRQEDGGTWREAIFLGQVVAAYFLNPKDKTGSLDRIIDSACIATP